RAVNRPTFMDASPFKRRAVAPLARRPAPLRRPGGRRNRIGKSSKEGVIYMPWDSASTEKSGLSRQSRKPRPSGSAIRHHLYRRVFDTSYFNSYTTEGAVNFEEAGKAVERE